LRMQMTLLVAQERVEKCRSGIVDCFGCDGAWLSNVAPAEEDRVLALRQDSSCSTLKWSTVLNVCSHTVLHGTHLERQLWLCARRSSHASHHRCLSPAHPPQQSSPLYCIFGPPKALLRIQKLVGKPPRSLNFRSCTPRPLIDRA
jgi:hypothetical protein